LIRTIGFAQEIRLLRAGREPLQDRREGARFRVEVTRFVRGRAGTATMDAVHRHGRPADLAGIVRLASERAKLRADAVAPEGGATAAVFAPGVGGVLVHEMIGHALEGDLVGSGGSKLVERGLRFVSEQVQVVDDPRRARAPWTIDDEGTPAGPTPLIRDGQVAGTLHDLRTASEARAAPTGHGRRSSYIDSVRPRMGCTFLGNGTAEAGDIVGSTASGVYIHRMETASVDSCAGIACFRVTDADLLRNGKPAAPLFPFLMTVSLEDTLATLDAIAADLAFDTCVGSCFKDGQPLAVSVGAPTFRIGVVKVFAAKESR